MHLLRPAALLLLVVCSTASATPSVKRTQTAAVLPAHVRLARGRALSSFKLGPRRADHAEDENEKEEEGHNEEGHKGHASPQACVHWEKNLLLIFFGIETSAVSESTRSPQNTQSY